MAPLFKNEYREVPWGFIKRFHAALHFMQRKEIRDSDLGNTVREVGSGAPLSITWSWEVRISG